MDVLIQIAGALVVLVTMVDVFLTVLLGGTTSLITSPMNRAVWRIFRWLARVLPAQRGKILPFAGPTLVLLTVVMWVTLLAVGFALVFMPALGEQISSSTDQTETGFWPAMYYSAMSLSTLGIGDFAATTTFYRLLTTLEAIIGFSMLTASLTYLMSIYSALISYNGFALGLHYASDETGNATNIIARLGPGGDFSSAETSLSAYASTLAQVHEAHQTYEVLRYFRLEEIAYGMPRTLLMVMDLTSLLGTAIDQQAYRTTTRSISIAQLHGLGLRMLDSLASHVAPHAAETGGEQSAPTEDAWRAHFRTALGTFADEGIRIPDERAAAEDAYVALRREWQPYVLALTDFLMHEEHDVLNALPE